MTNRVEPLICTGWIRHTFTKSRIPDKVFQPLPADHEKYVLKNIPSVNAEWQVVKHLVRIRLPKLPQGLPAEEGASGALGTQKSCGTETPSIRKE
ncbi:hypothetical protein GH733_015158 [Mirounga leonina]|nr:hypothetical protein GH733_015158 [Mirounga leonina]